LPAVIVACDIESESESEEKKAFWSERYYRPV
jgi:hypothetical protein